MMLMSAPLSRRRFTGAAIAGAALFGAGRLSAETEPVTVFAAASLTDAVTAITTSYQEATGQTVRLSFAASSTLARQIEAGAPAQIFLSANERWMDYVAERGLIAPGTRTSPIGNALVLIAPTGSPLDSVAPETVGDLETLLHPGERIAIADPDHTPVGLYARDSLESLGLWQTAEGRLARTQDVRAALALVARGEAPLGIVYATDAAVSSGVKIVGRFPEDSHSPITYPFAILAGQDRPDVRTVYGALMDASAQAVFTDAGFTLR